ncbi:hypothetical protein mRhiFer1_009455 [Rhinolophus ferrumequinum]|uniref:Uncharacterized protein n=1 Tax=Rhinolophus ferrumequinum TaxID=59479 RepID=A0A7J7RJ37_RHIFE|nr:hypothetical protein mRhiFer1_009455 [Rhinolophus ferrumequinum]
MRMSVPRRPSLLRTPHAHGRPHVTRSGGTVDLSPRARVGGSRPIGRRTTWRGRSRGGIRAARGGVGGLVAPSRAAGSAEGSRAGAVTRLSLRPSHLSPRGEEPSCLPGRRAGRGPRLWRALEDGGRRFVSRCHSRVGHRRSPRLSQPFSSCQPWSLRELGHGVL